MTAGPVRRYRRLQVQFLVALVGVLVVLGLVVGELAGPVGLGVYAAAVTALAAAGARWARSRALPPPGRTCSCCTSTVHDPVRVV